MWFYIQRGAHWCYLHIRSSEVRCVWAASPSFHWLLLVWWSPPPQAQSESGCCPGNTPSHEASLVACKPRVHPPCRDEKKRRDMYKGHQILSWCPDVAFVSVGARTLAPSSASRLWIMFQGAIPIATTRTVEEVLAREWSRTAWPKCLVMPKRRPLVRIHAPGEQSHWSFLEFLRGFKGKPNEYKIF